jgi:hypothetical protein
MLLLGVVIFLCGVVTGAGGAVYLTARAIRNSMSHPEGAPQHVSARLASRFHLTPDQTGKIEAIVRKHTEAILKIREESYPRFAEQVEQMKEEVASLLDERQAAEWRAEIERDMRFVPQPHAPGQLPRPPIKHSPTKE